MKKSLIHDLNNLSFEDNYSLSLMLLHKLSNNPKYSVLSELAYLMDKDSLINFLTYYGGKTIEVPTIDKLKSTLRTLILYQKYIVEKIPWDEALKMSGYKRGEEREAERYLTHFRLMLSSTKIGKPNDDDS